MTPEQIEKLEKDICHIKEIMKEIKEIKEIHRDIKYLKQDIIHERNKWADYLTLNQEHFQDCLRQNKQLRSFLVNIAAYGKESNFADIRTDC